MRPKLLVHLKLAMGSNCIAYSLHNFHSSSYMLRKPELIQECPSDQAYDACLTNIEQKGELINIKQKI